MKHYFYSLAVLCAVASAPCLASDVRADTRAITRAALSAKCNADADADAVHGKDRHKTICECFRKNAALTCIEPIIAAQSGHLK